MANTRTLSDWRQARALPQHITDDMNKLEAAYYNEVLWPAVREGSVINVWYEALNFRLAPNTHYLADFLVQNADGSLEIHEVKGFMRDDANVKLKLCAQYFPFPVFLVTRQRKRDGGQWEVLRV